MGISQDIGIDLGTANLLICDPDGNILLNEPSVVAVNTRTGDVMAVGDEANQMLGRTPDHVKAVMPLQDGVISDFDMTSAMIMGFMKKVYSGSAIRPRVIVCVPSAITDVESKAVVETAVRAGARKVYLIEEPVAAAIGSGIDITKPEGRVIVDIGGGTTDIAVLSFSGIVCKRSIKSAGRKLDLSIVRYVKKKHNVIIGEKNAEMIKKQIVSVYFDEDKSCEVKGKDAVTGLPVTITVTRSELKPVVEDLAEDIFYSLRKILEITPPELSADIYNTGIFLTGGGALIDGLDRYLEEKSGLSVYKSDNPIECVAIGTAKAFGYLGRLYDGFVKTSAFSHN